MRVSCKSHAAKRGSADSAVLSPLLLSAPSNSRPPRTISACSTCSTSPRCVPASPRTARVPTPSTGTSPKPTRGPTCPTRSSSTTASPSRPPKSGGPSAVRELVELFDREILGRVPANVPAVHWEVVSTTPGSDNGIATITKRLIGHVDNSAYPAITVNIEADLILPAGAHGPVPVVVEISLRSARTPLRRRPASAVAPLPPPSHPDLLHLIPALPSSSRSSPRAGATRCSIPPATRPTTALASPRASSASQITASRASSTTGAPCAPGPGAPRA
jgi:hypothetical protein